MVYKYRFPHSTDIKTQNFSVIINISMIYGNNSPLNSLIL